MSEQKIRKRIRERLALRLPVRVRSRETADFEWEEVTRLTSVTPFGAGFTLKRPTEKGRLLHMTIPMPRQFRLFDHIEDQYRVWALVRHVRSAGLPDHEARAFLIGVAFVGKRPPASYETVPTRLYDIAPSSLANPEQITEKTPLLVAPLSDSGQRVPTRHNIPVDILLETINEKGDVEATESTVTENISRTRATLFTTLSVLVGRFVRLTSKQYGVTVFAVVRSRNTGADGIGRMHVEFVDDWPLEEGG